MKKIFLNISVIICAVAFSACSKETFDFEGNDGMIFVKAGNSNMVNSTSNSFVGNFLKTPVGTMGGMTAKFPVNCSEFASEAVTATFEVDLSLVDAYNSSHGTKYAPYNKQIQLKNPQLVIPQGATQSSDSVEIVLNSEDIAMLEAKSYLIPIKLSNSTGKYQVSQKWSIVYCVLIIGEDKDNIWNIAPVNKGTLYRESKATWSVSANNSSFSSTAALLDNNYNNYSSYNIAQMNENTYYTLDLGEVKNNISGIENAYYSSSYCIYEYELLSSVDATTWEKQGVVSQTSVASVDAFFYASITARYLRVVPIKKKNSIYIKELSIYTK